MASTRDRTFGGPFLVILCPFGDFGAAGPGLLEHRRAQAEPGGDVQPARGAARAGEAAAEVRQGTRPVASRHWEVFLF